MKSTKIISAGLVLLGFGSVLSLTGSCASRASKSRTTEPGPAADTVVVTTPDDMPVQVMYGVRPAIFNPEKIKEFPAFTEPAE